MGTRGRDAEIGYLRRQEAIGPNKRKSGSLGQASLGPRGPGQGPRAKGGSASSQDLGQPLTLRQVAAVLGVSPWSVRQTWLRLGLPFVRAGRRGRFIFFQKEVERFLRNLQGGTYK